MTGKRLNFQFVKNVAHSGRKGPDKHFDEHGLILRVRASGSKHWIWRATVRGRRRDLGLGTFPYVSLGEAREKAFEYRRLAKAGENPAAAYAPEGTTDVEPKSNAPTFRKAAAAVIDLQSPDMAEPEVGCAVGGVAAGLRLPRAWGHASGRDRQRRRAAGAATDLER